MTGKRIGYIRVSSEDQNPDRQLEGVQLDEKFIEKASAKTQERPQLQNMLIFARRDDHVLVHSIDRLARNLRDLQDIVDKLTSKGVSVFFAKENLLFDGSNNSSMSKLLLQIMGSFAEFERSLIHERQAEGIRLARLKKTYKGKKPMFNAEQVVEIKKMRDLGVPIVKIARHFHANRFTIYKYLKVKNG